MKILFILAIPLIMISCGPSYSLTVGLYPVNDNTSVDVVNALYTTGWVNFFLWDAVTNTNVWGAGSSFNYDPNQSVKFKESDVDPIPTEQALRATIEFKLAEGSATALICGEYPDTTLSSNTQSWLYIYSDGNTDIAMTLRFCQ